MSKQTIDKVETNVSADVAAIAGQVGAWVLTAAALLAASEKVIHNADFIPHAAPVYAHATHQPETIRAEGARETARLPEEYDVGLRSPFVSGA